MVKHLCHCTLISLEPTSWQFVHFIQLLFKCTRRWQGVSNSSTFSVITISDKFGRTKVALFLIRYTAVTERVHWVRLVVRNSFECSNWVEKQYMSTSPWCCAFLPVLRSAHMQLYKPKPCCHVLYKRRGFFLLTLGNNTYLCSYEF